MSVKDLNFGDFEVLLRVKSDDFGTVLALFFLIFKELAENSII
jgi:hypothetical protein